MPSFSESFKMLFLATKATTANSNQVLGFITTAGIGTQKLITNTGVAATDYGVGSWGLFDASTWKSVTNASVSTNAPKVVLASCSLYDADKIGQFHGGYQESVKSKDIDPRYIVSFEKYSPCTARQHSLHIGHTKYSHTLSPSNSACDFEFVCGQDYNLRVDIKGEPAYHFLNRNIYRILPYNSGCCTSDAPGATVDGTLAFIAWANAILADPELQNFVTPIVYSEAGVAHYPPGTAGQFTWDNYVSPGHVDGKYAGMRLTGAYVDTVFGDCSFSPTDYYNKVPIHILAGMVDFNGDPCAFTGVCVVTECNEFAGSGFGETVLRDMIQSERYRQNNFADDQRIREVMMSDDLLTQISRTSSYTRYTITHYVPRSFNPSGSYSRDLYTLNIITNGTVAQFETIMATLLSNAKNPVTLQSFSCGTCTPLTP